MNRLHQMTEDEVIKWAEARADWGKKVYGDKHLKRYNLVDVFEELLDAVCIINLFSDRILRTGRAEEVFSDNALGAYLLIETLDLLFDSMDKIQMLDALVPDEYCTDEECNGRIFFSKWAEQESGEV